MGSKFPPFPTREEFEAWLVALPDDYVFEGRKYSWPKDCPLAVFTGWTIGVLNYYVHAGLWPMYPQGELPKWAQEYVVKSDRIGVPLTKALALRALRQPILEPEESRPIAAVEE